MSHESLSTPIRHLLLVFLLQPAGLFVFLPCVSITAVRRSFYKSCCYSVQARLSLILWPLLHLILRLRVKVEIILEKMMVRKFLQFKIG